MRTLPVATLVMALAVASCGRGATPAATPVTPSATLSATTDATSVPVPMPSDAALEVAPDFTIATLDGGTFTLSDHRDGLPVVLNFWAPW